MTSGPTLGEGGSGTTSIAWICTFATLVLYFGYILMIVFVPEVMAAPVVAGSHMNIAILVGIFVILFCIVLAFVYTNDRNKKDVAP
jgi:uncharacterized membrane protein (DUF485 family)